jgi:hypothetical protein
MQTRNSLMQAFWRLCIAASALGSVCFSPTSSEAATTLYTTQADFNAAAPSASLLENFATAPINIALPSFTIGSGTYSGNPNVFVAPPGFTNFGAAVASPTTQIIVTASGNENITVSFTTPYHAVGFEAFFNGLGPLTLAVYGAGNTLLAGFPILPLGLDPATGLADKGYLGFTSDQLIYGFQWVATGGETLNTGFTNISAQAADLSIVTPLPAALPLFATGLGALGLLGWRRKKKKAAALAA